MGQHKIFTCNCQRCKICLEGVRFCSVCLGADKSLPKECPERMLTIPEGTRVEEGRLDFVRGTWVVKDVPTAGDTP